jgi:hypothetical protein
MTADENEWYGQPHTLTVHSVRPPDGPLDDGDLEYDLEHPPSCKEEERDWSGVKILEWACDVADHQGDGLAFSLRYSGTPITKPGTYRIQAWGRKSWTELGYEYDGGVGVMDPEDTP